MLKNNLIKRGFHLATGFFILGIVTRLPFQSKMLYHWDSVNFALGMQHYDISLHQPHPPGYILYVLLGKIFDWIFHDPNTSLVCISILFSGLITVMVFWLGKAMFNQNVGIISALLTLTSPSVWFHGEIALSYITEGVFVTVIAYCCYQVLKGESRFILPSALILGLAGGFRQNTLVLMFPLWLFSLVRLTWRQRATACTGLFIVVSLWLTVMISLSGGISNYWEALRGQTETNVGLSAAGSLSTVAMNIARMVIHVFYALTLGVTILPLSLYWFIHRWRLLIKDPSWQVLGVWILPCIVFYLFFLTQAGLIFTFLPGILILTAFTLVEMFKAPFGKWVKLGINTKLVNHFERIFQIKTGYLMAIMVLTANLAFFFTAPAFLLGEKRQLFNTTSWSSINTRNITLSEKINAIRSRFSPSDTVILADQFDYRHPDYYFSDYKMPSLSHEIFNTEGIDLADNIKNLVLFNEDIQVTTNNLEILREESLPGGSHLRWIQQNKNIRIHISNQGVIIINN